MFAISNDFEQFLKMVEISLKMIIYSDGLVIDFEVNYGKIDKLSSIMLKIIQNENY